MSASARLPSAPTDVPRMPLPAQTLEPVTDEELRTFSGYTALPLGLPLGVVRVSGRRRLRLSLRGWSSLPSSSCRCSSWAAPRRERALGCAYCRRCTSVRRAPRRWWPPRLYFSCAPVFFWHVELARLQLRHPCHPSPPGWRHEPCPPSGVCVWCSSQCQRGLLDCEVPAAGPVADPCIHCSVHPGYGSRSFSLRPRVGERYPASDLISPRLGQCIWHCRLPHLPSSRCRAREPVVPHPGVFCLCQAHLCPRRPVCQVVQRIR